MKTETRRSFCRFCHAACPVDVEVQIDEDPGQEGAPKETAALDRLRQPLRRHKDGAFEPVSSAEALDDFPHMSRRSSSATERMRWPDNPEPGPFKTPCRCLPRQAFHAGIGLSPRPVCLPPVPREQRARGRAQTWRRSARSARSARSPSLWRSPSTPYAGA